MRVIVLLLLAAAASGCADGHGRTDYGRSVLLGAGIGAGAGLLGGIGNDIANSQRGSYGYGHPPGRRHGW